MHLKKKTALVFELKIAKLVLPPAVGSCFFPKAGTARLPRPNGLQVPIPGWAY